MRHFNNKTRKGVSDGRSSLGVLSEARPVEDDQTESETDNWKYFFGSESEDDMKISHAAGKADDDEVAIRSGDGHTDAEDPGSEETKAVKMKKTPKQPSEREEHERTHLPFRDWGTHCVKAESRNDPHKREKPT